MTSRLLMKILIMPAVLLLGACNDDGIPVELPGGGGGGGNVTIASYNGLWDGAYVGSPPGDASQWASTFVAMLHDGRLMLYESNGQVWDSAFTPTGAATMRASDVVVYGANGIQLTRVLINGSLAGADSMNLSYDLGTGVGLIQMQYGSNDTAYNRGSSLSQLADIWSVAADDEAGAPGVTLAINNVDDQAIIDGANSNSCQYNGVIELIDAARNLYRITEFVVTDGVAGACDVITVVNVVDNEAPDGSGTRREEVVNPFAGSDYTGFATLLPDQDTLLMVVTNGVSRALSFELAR